MKQREALAVNGIHSLNQPSINNIFGIYTCDARGRITYFNDAAVQLWGCRPELNEDSRKFCANFRIHHADGEELSSSTDLILTTLATGEQFRSLESIIERGDGSKMRAYIDIDPIYGENDVITGAISVFHDIEEIPSTESEDPEKGYKQEWLRSEERYYKMIEEVEDYAILLLDRDGNIQNWNRGAEKIKGYKEEEILGKSFRLFYLEEDRKRQLPEMLINQARVKGKAIHEGWRLRKDGSRFWGSVVLTALHDDFNNVIGFSKVTRDLTERKLAEDKMRDYTSQLEFQNKELEQFAYVASHDMKEPLRKITFFLSSVLDDNKESLSPKVREYLNKSIGSAKRMTDLIKDLLTYSQTTPDSQNFELVNLQELVGELGHYHKDQLELKEVRFEIGHLPVIQGIPFQIKQLFDNLINNSIKYKHRQRDVVITVTSEIVSGSQVADAAADRNNNYHHIIFRDNGIGFSQEYSKKIFELFQRLHSDSLTKGSGVGLTICKKIIQNHKGFILATGKQNEGAQFDIYIPVNK